MSGRGEGMGAQRQLITLLQARLTMRLLHNDKSRFFTRPLCSRRHLLAVLPRTSLCEPTTNPPLAPASPVTHQSTTTPISVPFSLPPLSAPNAAAHPAPSFNGTCH